jgi:hypothetical protein
MEENLQNMTLLSQIEQDIIVEYSFIPTPILESFYKIRQYCGLMLSEIDSVSKQLSDILYAQSCTKATFPEKIKPYSQAFLHIMYMNNRDFAYAENLLQFGNYWQMYSICRHRVARIVYIDGGKNVDRIKNLSLIRFYEKNPLHKGSGKRKCAQWTI